MKVGKLVRFAAEKVGAAVNVGAAADPVKLPKTVLAAAVDCVNVRAGVLVDVATEVVKSGERVPAEKDVTVPAPAAYCGIFSVAPERVAAPLDPVVVRVIGA